MIRDSSTDFSSLGTDDAVGSENKIKMSLALERARRGAWAARVMVSGPGSESHDGRPAHGGSASPSASASFSPCLCSLPLSQINK